jgi:hypothetical protein
VIHFGRNLGIAMKGRSPVVPGSPALGDCANVLRTGLSYIIDPEYSRRRAV